MKRGVRIGAAMLALLLIAEVISPSVAYALSSGPSQPEVQGFQPAGANDLVDLFSGDMSYNIPLMDVEGYPINLFYNGSIGMDQEASWVGLGWNLNPGVVERNLRGLPDDFRGDVITREMNLRPNRTYGLSFNPDVQIFSVGSPWGADLSVSPSFNNYDGARFEANMSLSMKSTLGSNATFTGSLGLKSSSNQGMQMQPSVGFDREICSSAAESSVGLNFGLAMDSRQGLTNSTLGLNMKASTYHFAEGHGWSNYGTSTGVSGSFDYGSPTYTPSVGMPMRNRSLSFFFTGGTAFSGAHPNMTLGAFYSEQTIRDATKHSSAFGYLHLDAGQGSADALLDQNREKDGPYSGYRTALGVATLTNDIFSVSGQGMSGSYRAFRSEVGHVYDPYSSSSGSGGSGGIDVGGGLLAHGGARIMVNSSTSHSGVWDQGNQASARLRYRTLKSRPELERVFFREANEPVVEQDSMLWEGMRKDEPVHFTLPNMGQYTHALGSKLANTSQTTDIPQVNYRTKREPRAQVFSYLDHAHAVKFAIEPPKTHYFPVPAHHMSEVTVTGKDGGRYVYGVPAYNVNQYDVEFNVDRPESSPGLVFYNAEENTADNENGVDHFFSKTHTPSYAYAFLLSSILSADYSDSDDEQGPSEGDLGAWTEFEYVQDHSAFQWRTPATQDALRARISRGREAVEVDNKGTYVYGTKEVYHLSEIESRNYRAVFHTSARADARGVSENGLLNSQALQRLDSISLFTKDGSQTVPVKRVHFDYDYSLCGGTPNSAAVGGGKLTLKKVWFSYGASGLGVTTPYIFTYPTGDRNPSYEMNAQDRWGNMKPDSWSGVYSAYDTGGDASPRFTRNDDFPYAEQVPALADHLAGCWTLQSIRLPSGGEIHLEYESDDYSHVQDRPAMRMFRICGISNNVATPVCAEESEEMAFGTDMTGLTHVPRHVLWFKLPEDLEHLSDAELARTTASIRDLYFRAKVRMWPGSGATDHVSGYARFLSSGFTPPDVDGGRLGYVELEKVSVDEGMGFQVNPIYRAALEHLQLNYPTEVAGNPLPTLDDDQNVSKSFFYSMVNGVAGFVTNFNDFFNGPNEALHGRSTAFCENMYANESWIRLYEPDGNKKGGGYRVRSVRFEDNWSVMQSDETLKENTYGQDYTYTKEDGSSSGVAAYEPMSGADENPFRTPVYNSPTRALSPDDRFYQEEPFGELMFPGPSVGYSRVTVANHYPDATTKNAQGTGTVVSEFFTALDFPTIVNRTELKDARGHNSSNLLAFFGFKSIDHMHATQGFVVETNDMHGKPKRTTVFPEGSSEAVSYVEYEYASRPHGSARRLVNTAVTIAPDGTIGRAEIGRQYEFLSDMREFTSKGVSGGADVKFELLYAVVAGVPVPLCLPQFSSSSTRYKTGTMVKKIHRFGSLRRVVKMENGSVVSTDNLAYDAITGAVLLTRTANDFKDPIYSMSFPAYWHYEGMGPAYRNIGTQLDLVSIPVSGDAIMPSASLYFAPGDEVGLERIGFGLIPTRAWVDRVDENGIHLIGKDGQPIGMGDYMLMVLRSGRRNMIDMNMMDLKLLSDPLQGLTTNLYDNILDSKAVEFDSEWGAECACLSGATGVNDWVLNRKGVWRLSKENLFLSARTRSIENANSNIRRDGTYSSFAPFYRALNGQWDKHPAGWTTARTVTHYGKGGQELQNVDALGIYSSATFGHRATLPRTVARNAQYQENGFDGFEDPISPSDCGDQHFRFPYPTSARVNTSAHSGRHSIRVSSGSPVEFGAEPWDCPPPPCSLSFTIHFGVLVVTGATGAFTVEAEVLTGDAVCMPTTSGMSVEVVGPDEDWEIRFTVRDASGCSYSRIAHYEE